ncbi:hypothetical protein [Winogradskyella sp.]|uniref:hypothetical protein n=1 Tax=Winogradskyella sp. TaxID=1883156 RepID=UPI003BAD1FD2
MDVKPKHFSIKKIGLQLIFFAFLYFVCHQSSTSEVDVVYVDGKATEINYTPSQESSDVQIFLEGNRDTPVLGSSSSEGTSYSFRPVVPFTPGKTYVLIEDDRIIDTFTIRPKMVISPPELVAIYPTVDTVPENLLKMYIQFSKPMQQVGSALDYIKVINETQRKEVDVFLELSTELWNKEHTRLTLWLDPGRIKTDLIPNKEKGLPILKGHTYKLVISSGWKDSQGIPLATSYEKLFFVVDRDSKQPNIKTWKLEAQTDRLIIHFHEPLDAILAKESFNIKNVEGKTVSGIFELAQNEQILEFYPEQPFKSENYMIYVDSQLEDLAGNNLNHLFDHDVLKGSARDTLEVKTLSFTID